MVAAEHMRAYWLVVNWQEGTAKVIAYNVLKPIADTLPVTRQITQEIFDLLQSEKLVDDSRIYLDDSYLGAGYGIPTDSMREAVRLMAHEEGLFP